MQSISDSLAHITRELNRRISSLVFSDPVQFVYNPLQYARAGYFRYLELYGNSRKKVIFLGMNPGPWGMAQTGVPFGEIEAVTGWLKISATIDLPPVQHPRKTISGFHCSRSEVSGRRLWGMAQQRFVSPEAFFRENFVANYCPLLFLDRDGRNITPDKLRAEDKNELFKACDEHLSAMADILRAPWVVGIGNFSYLRAQRALDPLQVKVEKILHPSPASPKANRGWQRIALEQLKNKSIWLD